MVIPGTSWKWYRSTGLTAICAAMLVEAASATGRGRNRDTRPEIGVASDTIPAVAATESWKPIDQTSHGSRISSSSTAAARTAPVARGRPASTPSIASDAITPARRTEGSAPVSTTKDSTVSIPSANRPHRARPIHSANAMTGASTIATFSPETTSR